MSVSRKGAKALRSESGTQTLCASAPLRDALPDVPVLSVRQPWAWLIVNGYKNIENRTWPTRVRGRILIHASKGMTRADYEACILFIMSQGMDVPVPPMIALERGGIVGETTILDCVSYHPSDWFVGPWGFVVDDSKPLPFEPCVGALGFFRHNNRDDFTAAKEKQ